MEYSHLNNFYPVLLLQKSNCLNRMKGVDISKACGFDRLGNRIIKLCNTGFHPFFTRLINLCLSIGQYPTEWKLANVIPLFKNGNRQLKVNYRPVSLPTGKFFQDL